MLSTCCSTRGRAIVASSTGIPGVEAESQRGWVRNAFRSPWVLTGVGIVVFFVAVAIIGPHFVGDPSATGSAILQPPSRHDLLGTTQTGQDVFAQLVDGAEVSLIVGIVS